MHPLMMPERRRLLDRLIREIYRGEVHAAEHATREEALVGAVPPVLALREVANHVVAMRERFDTIVRAYDLQTGRTGIARTLSTLRGHDDRSRDPERAYRTYLLDLRHGIDVVRLAREVTRSEELFGIIRWCDDWLGARCTLVARVEAQLVWFIEEAGVELIPPSAVGEVVSTPPIHAGTTIALPPCRHEQEEAPPAGLGAHPSRTT